MTVQVADTSVRTAITVQAPIERAFSVFTEGINTWWDPNHHLLEGFDHMVFEPRVGGHIYDVSKDGSECRWARVLAYEPPHRLVFSWDINLAWEVESDPEKTSEVEVSFTEAGPGRTRVELEHRHLERHGDGWEGMRDAVGSPNGWNLDGYAQAVAGAGA
jgi:uncharacterized protein YndB with AHSA1/START domain